ncbi:MAG: hypothetical protein ACP5KB_00650 [Thermoprotei archaeon]
MMGEVNTFKNVKKKPKVIYEDEEVMVMRAPSDEELEEIVLSMIESKGRPLTWKELRKELSGLVGEDRLRKALLKLIDKDLVVEMIDGTFGLKDMEATYIPKKIKKRVRPLSPKKFRVKWGPLIEARGSISAAIQYLKEARSKKLSSTAVN